MKTIYAPERTILDAFQRNPDAWRGVVMAWLYAGLSDLVDHCSVWYGTLPNPHGEVSR
jgi:hypothetical protein